MTLTYLTTMPDVQPAPHTASHIDYAEAALEDRCAPRTKLRIPASLRPSGFKGFSIIVKDLSISGFSAEALTGMKAGTRVFITMPGLAALEAEIAWNDGTMIGCAFQNLLNEAVLDSILNRFSVVEEG
ncbi:PilZ domain-containing protein [Sphingorhabdus arenilitoris]|uniref:PilZ domain-containing protein n=1 Tax=Sphingorhabdus arenilitoris TaxID=1490041 RepID=A0ABV8RHX3_9SPHN